MIAVTITASILGNPAGPKIDLAKGLNSPAAKKIVAFRLRTAGVDITSEMKRQAPRDTGQLANSSGYAVDEEELRMFLFNRAGYAAAVHEGRKPGKRPPTAALIPWCRRHIVNRRIGEAIANAAIAGVKAKFGVRKSATKDELAQAKVMAFLVARAIGRRGTRPRPWFANVIRDTGLPRIVRAGNEMGQDLSKAVSNALAAKLQSQFNKGGPS